MAIPDATRNDAYRMLPPTSSFCRLITVLALKGVESFTAFQGRAKAQAVLPIAQTQGQSLQAYKVILKRIWTYGIQLWGSASISNIEILERFQGKV
jgi:hypothetical protein